MEEHEHQWAPHLADAEAYFSKRGDGSDSITCRGQVLRCVVQPCEFYLVVPHNRSLQPVEAVAA